MIELLKDPFMYINYGAATIGIYLIRKFGKEICRDIEKDRFNPLVLIFFLFVAGATLYISWEAGNVSLEKLGYLK